MITATQFQLNPRLADDTTWIGDFPLCRVLLHKENMSPWFILVPKINQISELHHLSVQNQITFMKESCLMATFIETNIQPDKINIASIGNLVPQLHIHHVPRFKNDFAWPNPIWGNTPNQFRTEIHQAALSLQWQTILSQDSSFVPNDHQPISQ